MSKLSKSWIVLLVVILLLGAFLSFYQLGHKSLWYDEILSASHAKTGIKNILFYNPPEKEMWKNAHPVLHYVFIHYSLKLGSSDFFARLPSALFGFFTILLIFFTGRKLFDEVTGIISSFLSASSLLLIAHAQEARMYTQFAFFSLLSLFFLLKILYDENDNLGLWFGFILAATANLYTHTFATIVIANELCLTILILLTRIFCNLDRKKNAALLLKFFLSFACIATLSSPEFLKSNNLIRQHKGGEKLARGVKLSWSFLEKIRLSFSPHNPFLQKVFAVCFFIGLGSSCYKRGGRFFILVLWLIFPIAAILSVKAKHFFDARYIIFMLPVFLLCVSKGLQVILFLLESILKKILPFLKRFDVLSVLLLSAMTWIIIAEKPNFIKFYSLEKDNWKAAGAYLQDHITDHDIIYSDRGDYESIGYYFDTTKKNNIILSDRKLLEEKDPDRFWFVTYRSSPESFLKNYLITDQQTFKSHMVRAYLLERILPPKYGATSLIPHTIRTGETLSFTVSVHNPDKKFPQLVSLWVSLHEQIKYTTIVLPPGETIQEPFSITAPDEPGTFSLKIEMGSPPCTFFPKSSRFYHQIGYLEIDKTSPSVFVIHDQEDKYFRGYFMYGPYVTFPAGSYTAFFIVKGSSSLPQVKGCVLTDIVSEGGKTTHGKRIIQKSELEKKDEYVFISVPFSLDNPTELEFRLSRLAPVNIYTGGIILQKNDPNWRLNPNTLQNTQNFTITVKEKRVQGIEPLRIQ